jgi:histidine triad (HIT) family protein
MSVIGLEVPHVHVHLIPINLMRDMTFQHKITLSPEKMTELAEAIASHFE